MSDIIISDNHQNIEKKKTYNHYKILVSNFSNKLATMEWELKSVNNYFSKEPYPRLYELFCYMLTWNKDVIGVDDNYFKIDITIKTLKDILISKFNYQWNNFRRDMRSLYKTTERIEIYSPKLNKTLSIAPIILTDILIDGRPVNKKQLEDFEAWESVVILYDRRMFQYAYNGTEAHFTLPTTYSSYMQHYTKSLKPIIVNFLYSRLGSKIDTYSDEEKQKRMSKTKRTSYITADKAYSIINYLLDTSNENESKIIKKRTIDLLDFAKRCYPYCLIKKPNGSLTLRYKELEIAIFQTLFIHNSILLETQIENKFLKLTCDIHSLEINKKEKKAYIDIVNLKKLQKMINVALCVPLYADRIKCLEMIKKEQDKQKFVILFNKLDTDLLRLLGPKENLTANEVTDIFLSMYFQEKHYITKAMRNLVQHFLSSI